MSKVDIKRLDSLSANDTAATASINDNFKAVQDAIENTLSRDGTTPNFMDTNLDMNSYKIINTGEATEDNDVVTLKYVREAIGNATADADRAEAAAARADSSAQSAEVAAANARVSAQASEDAAQSAVNTVNGFDAHAEEAKNNFDRNYNDKLVAFNINAVDKQNDFDTNAATLTARYDNNDLAKTKAFNENAQTMTDGYNQNAMLKIDDFDAHYTIKEMEFDDHAAIKQGEVDASASKAKQSELNAATSEANAKASENNAKNSENASGISEDNARESERLAREHKEAAQLSETNAKTSEDNAAMSASDAKLSAQASALSEQSAKDSADKATKAVANIDVDIARAETAATNAEKFANGTIEEYPEGSAKYWKDQAQAIVGSGQMLLDVDQDVNSSKTFLKDQAIKSPDLDIRNDRSKRGNGLIFTDKNGTQTAGIGIYINNNQSPECRFVASNGNKSAFAGLGVTTDGQGFFEIPEPSDTSNNNDAVSSRWVNKKVNTKQDKLSTAQIIATNSGITAAKVETYDGYNVTIDGKQAQLNAAQLNAVNSGITSAKVSTYDGYKALIDGKQPAGNYQTVGNLSQTLDASVSKYPSNKAVATAIANIDLTSRADTNLSNLSQAGKDVIKANSGGGLDGKITNCLTEIPQDIKLELKDNTLTLRAGSIFYIPNGTNNFDKVVTTQDKTLSNAGNGSIFADAQGNLKVGGTFGMSDENLTFFYDTAVNTIQWCNRYGETESTLYSLPLGEISETNSLDIFNGFGYMYSTIYALPGVKGLIPDGRNADGSLKNIEFTTDKVITKTFESSSTNSFETMLNTKALYAATDTQVIYDEKENLNKYLGTKTDYCNVGISVVSSGRITSFTPKQVFQAVDYNDKSEITSWGFPSDRFIGLNLGASGSKYTAPADGYFYFSKVAGKNLYYLSLAIDGKMALNNYASYETNVLNAYIPVHRGDVVTVSYNAIGATVASRFIYAEGEK